MTLAERFLRAKHWQMFLLLFGLPLIFQFIMMGLMFVRMFRGEPPDPTRLFGLFTVFPILIFVFSGFFFLWFWSIAIGLQKKIPPTVKMSTGTFKIFFFIPVVYILLICVGMSVLMNIAPDMAESGAGPPNALVFGSMALIIPLHFFSMFCIFYCLYFVAKTFRTAELQREANFSDYAGEFFLLWFYPIGVWIIQPRVNQLVEKPAQVTN